jgi:hypothetical protein
MQFAVEVGETEKSLVEYNFNQLMGSLLIKVNNQPVTQTRRLINEPVVEVHTFEVGQMERATVRIEKHRKQLLGHRSRLYVNNRLVRVFDGL